MNSYTLKKIQYTEDDGVWCDSTLNDLEDFVKNEGLQKEAQELFAKKRRYIKAVDGCMFRLVWKRS